MKQLVLLLVLVVAAKADQMHASLVAGAAILVSVPDQELVLLDRGKVVARYPVSTSKFGTGDQSGSYRTPVGTLFVSGNFGDKLPCGAVI